MMATRALVVPSPLYDYIVHVFDAMGHKQTLIAYKPDQLIIKYKSDRNDRHTWMSHRFSKKCRDE